MSESNKPSCLIRSAVVSATVMFPCRKWKKFMMIVQLMQGTIFPELDLNMCEYGKVCKQWGGGMWWNVQELKC